MARDSFKDFVLDQLACIGQLSCRRMFGGYGFYADKQFFAILFDDRLYFKVGDATRGQYVERGMQPFQPKPGQRLGSYCEVPPDVLEDARELVVWANAAVQAARSTA